MSVVEVVKPGTFNGGVPIKGGLNDPLLGASDPRSTCSTCKNTYAGSGKINECPGHFGHIEVSAGSPLRSPRPAGCIFIIFA